MHPNDFVKMLKSYKGGVYMECSFYRMPIHTTVAGSGVETGSMLFSRVGYVTDSLLESLYDLLSHLHPATQLEGYILDITKERTTSWCEKVIEVDKITNNPSNKLLEVTRIRFADVTLYLYNALKLDDANDIVRFIASLKEVLNDPK